MFQNILEMLCVLSGMIIIFIKMKVWNDTMCKIYKMSDQIGMGNKIFYNLG